MDFIETIFGVSPDGGNGMLEVAYLVAAVIFVSLVATKWRAARRGRNESNDRDH